MSKFKLLEKDIDIAENRLNDRSVSISVHCPIAIMLKRTLKKRVHVSRIHAYYYHGKKEYKTKLPERFIQSVILFDGRKHNPYFKEEILRITKEPIELSFKLSKKFRQEGE